ncbi:putative acyl-CoA synthetase [Carnobacterium sp. AT7]|uniref:long-chain-fatty-acid--CoA ligase FadD n=1 Tax=Carnobacterium TaxID=2747 RepID=UPI00015F2CCC|nr:MULTISPECIES: AMP-binding protein [Carnobacterium]EDP69304.1 putative acyl-CoA synthetase [Carnobacterium sp. AT7]
MNLDWIKVRSLLTPDRIALVDPIKNSEWTYKEVNVRAENLAHYLKKNGVTKGDRVALYAPNDISYFDVLLASIKIGAIFIPLNWRLKPIEIKKVVEDAQPKVILHASQISKRLSLVDAALLSLDVDSKEYNEICEHPNHVPFLSESIELESPVMLIYTTGTTGDPKGAIITHNGMVNNSMNTIISWNITHEDITIASAPMFHIAGISGMIIPLMLIGGKVIIDRYFDGTNTNEMIKQYKPTMLFMVPTMYYGLISATNFHKDNLASVHTFVAGGSPPLKEVVNYFVSEKLPLINSYGLTEVGPNNFKLMSETALQHPFSIGYPSFFVEAKIVNDQDEEVEQGQIGELLLAGQHTFAGYWQKQEETAKAFLGDFVRTGDLAKKDENGLFYIVDRKKEMIITGGENVLPSEVERVLNAHPAVKDSVVVGYEHPRYGQSVGAAIIFKDKERSEAELDQYMTDNLAGYKTPKHYLFVDVFPTNSVGKTDKKEIIRLLNEWTTVKTIN